MKIKRRQEKNENRGEMETSLNGDRKKMKCRGDGERRNTDIGTEK